MRRLVALVAWLASVPLAASALTLAPMSLGQMTEASELVVRARCVDRAATRTDDGAIESVVRFEVLETAKGTAEGVVEIREPGGTVDGTEMVVPGAPRSRVGDEAVLFLERAPDDTLRVVGMALGYLPVVTAGPGASRVRVSPHLGPGFEAGGLRPVTDVLTRVRTLAERPR